jgi:membrane protease YdiL (CAAX protease family)
VRSELWPYFLLTYVLTWSFTIPFVIVWNTILNQSFSPWVLIFLPGAYGPTLAALILTARAGGVVAVKELLRKFLVWRVPLIWYAFALLIPILVVALAVACSGSRSALVRFNPSGLSVAPLAIIAALPFGPLAEELGWRGFAQPRLLKLRGLWTSSMIIGLAWTFWHTPMFWFPGAAIPSFLDPGVMSIALYFAQTTAQACLMTFLFVVSRGSVLLAVLYHASSNTAETILYSTLPEPTAAQELQVYLMGIALSWILAAVLLAWLGRRCERYTHGGEPTI